VWPYQTATSVAFPVQEVSDEREDADEEKNARNEQRRRPIVQNDVPRTGVWIHVGLSAMGGGQRHGSKYCRRSSQRVGSHPAGAADVAPCLLAVYECHDECLASIRRRMTSVRRRVNEESAS
jgi:hypothetical protein